jgi:hypothetical protein
MLIISANRILINLNRVGRFFTFRSKCYEPEKSIAVHHRRKRGWSTRRKVKRRSALGSLPKPKRRSIGLASKSPSNRVQILATKSAPKENSAIGAPLDAADKDSLSKKVGGFVSRAAHNRPGDHEASAARTLATERTKMLLGS